MNTETVKQDLSDYLIGDSEFMQIAADILPSRAEVESCKDATYCHKRSNAGFEMIELHTCYDPEAYSRVISNAENNLMHLQNASAENLEKVFVDGHVYTCILIQTQDGYYAVAYSACSDCHSASWLFFTTEQLSYMSIADALSYCK